MLCGGSFQTEHGDPLPSGCFRDIQDAEDGLNSRYPKKPISKGLEGLAS